MNDASVRGLVALALAPLLAGSALAANDAGAAQVFHLGPVAFHGDGEGLVQVGAGVFDADDDQDSVAANLEYRFGSKLLVFGPALGLVANTDGGIYVDVSFGSVHLTPLLGAGVYRRGDSKDLGSVFEFRQSIDLAWRFANGWRVGLRIAHVSNADLDDRNPGEEEVYLTVAAPSPW